MKHTQGPWTVNILDRQGNYRLSVRTNVSSEEALANAKLMEAAPDLLEALKSTLILLEKSYETEDDLFGLIDQVKKTIAKAEGTES